MDRIRTCARVSPEERTFRKPPTFNQTQSPSLSEIIDNGKALNKCVRVWIYYYVCVLDREVFLGLLRCLLLGLMEINERPILSVLSLTANPRLHPKNRHQNLSTNTEYDICSKAAIIGILRGEFTGFMACKATSEFANKTHLKICSKRR